MIMTERRLKANIWAAQFYQLNKELVYTRQRISFYRKKIRECSDSTKLNKYQNKLAELEAKVKTFKINHV